MNYFIIWSVIGFMSWIGIAHNMNSNLKGWIAMRAALRLLAISIPLGPIALTFSFFVVLCEIFDQYMPNIFSKIGKWISGN